MPVREPAVPVLARLCFAIRRGSPISAFKRQFGPSVNHLSAAAIQASHKRGESLLGRGNMKKFLAAAVIGLSFAPVDVIAQERAGDAALGALSGAVVLGPVGALAGAVVGYTAGPSIARSWGLRGSEGHHQERPAKRSISKQGGSTQGADRQGVATESPKRSESAGAQNAIPPVQAFE